MDKAEFKKNRLDMEYRFESQKALICLTAGTITLIGFLAAMIIQKYYTIGFIMGFIIFVVSMFYYTRAKKRLDKILKEIENLKK